MPCNGYRSCPCIMLFPSGCINVAAVLLLIIESSNCTWQGHPEACDQTQKQTRDLQSCIANDVKESASQKFPGTLSDAPCLLNCIGNRLMLVQLLMLESFCGQVQDPQQCYSSLTCCELVHTGIGQNGGHSCPGG